MRRTFQSFAAHLLFAASVALALWAPRRAMAGDDDVTEMARQRFREGVQFYDQRQYEKARLAFLQSYAIKPHPATLLNLAQSELRGGHPDDAANHFSEYLRTNTRANENEKQEAELGFTAAKAKVGEVTIAVDASGAQVSVDGQEKGVSPLPGPLYMMPGSHNLEARSNDRNVTKTVSVNAGQAVSINLSFRGAAAAAAAPAGGSPAGGSAPGPEAEAGAPEQGASPQQGGAAEPEHLEVSTSGRKPFFKWLVTTPAAIVLAGVGVLSLGTSAGTAIGSSHSYENAKNLQDQIIAQRDSDQAAGFFGEPARLDPKNNVVGPCNLSQDHVSSNGTPMAQWTYEDYLSRRSSGRFAEYADACKRYQDSVNTGDTLKTVAVVGAVLGGVAVVGTVVYYFLDSKESAQASAPKRSWARVVPWGTPGSAGGITIYGEF